MSKSEHNLELTRRWFHEVWNEHKEETIHEMLSPEAKGTGLSEDGALDFESFKSVWRAFLETFPDFNVHIDEWIVSGDKVAVHLICSGTHTGSALGIPPSGKKVQFDAQSMITWRDGKIVAGRNVADLGPVARQAQ